MGEMGLTTENVDQPGIDANLSQTEIKKRLKANRDSIDPVVREWNMYMNSSPESHLILLRYPEARTNMPYCAANRNKPTELRIKPISGLIEVDVPIDPLADTFDKVKGIMYGEALRKSRIMKERGGSYGIAGGFGLGGSSMKSRPGPAAINGTEVRDPTIEELLDDFDKAIRGGHVMSKITLGGHINIRNDTSPNLYVGHFKDSNVFFTKVDALCVLRPQLIHLDALNDQRKTALRMQSGADTEESEVIHVNMTIKKSEGDSADSVADTNEVARLLRAMREEPWQRLSWVDSEDPEAWDVFDSSLAPAEQSRRPQLTCNMTNEQWLDAISCPRIDPINPNKKAMRTIHVEDDLSSTDLSGEDQGADGQQ